MTIAIVFTLGYLSGGFTALLLIGITLVAQRTNAEEDRLTERARKQTQP